MYEQLVLIVHALTAVAMIGLILIQQGKGAEAGASFGGGGSQTVFGVQGGGNLLTRWTAILATVFFSRSFPCGSDRITVDTCFAAAMNFFHRTPAAQFLT